MNCVLYIIKESSSSHSWRSSLLESGDEILASLNDSEGEGGLTPPPAKRPRLVPQGGQGEPSSIGENSSRQGSSLGEYSGNTVEGSSPSSSAMQANGVIHENGTSISEFAVNGLGSLVKSNGCENISCEEENLNVGGASGHLGSVTVRKRKKRQLSSKDTDIVRLIGQHLREMGFK